MYVYIYTYMYTYIHICNKVVGVRFLMCLCVCMYIYIHAYTCIYVNNIGFGARCLMCMCNLIIYTQNDILQLTLGMAYIHVCTNMYAIHE